MDKAAYEIATKYLWIPGAVLVAYGDLGLNCSIDEVLALMVGLPILLGCIILKHCWRGPSATRPLELVEG